MVKAKFSEKEIEILTKLKAALFVKYVMDDVGNGVSAYCKLGIECDNICLDLLNEETDVDWFITDNNIKKEDISVFSCKIRNDNELFKPYIDGSDVITVCVNEKIKNVYIVSDYINVNSGEFTIDYDIAVIIETEQKKFIFSRGWFFSEEIYVNVDRDINEIYPIREVKDSWSNDGEFSVKVNRTLIKL